VTAPRRAIVDLFRPWLDDEGYTPPRLVAFDGLCERLGIPANDTAPPARTEPQPSPPRRPTELAEPGAFFAHLRSSGLFPKVRGIQLSGSQVEGINAKLTAFGKACWPIAFAACGFATSYWETGRAMAPVREKGSGDGADADPWDDYLERYDTGRLAARLGNTPEADGDGVRLAGAGDVQLTGADNYRRATRELRARGIIGPDVDLHANPELVLRPDISAAIMVLGMEGGWFTGRKLSDALPAVGPARLDQFIRSRPIINGTDKATDIARIAVTFQTGLQAGRWS
jgi:hypothetical protein